MKEYHTAYMRGGTNKGCFFRRDELPKDRDQWDRIFLEVMGSNDLKQIDGLGCGSAFGNKVVVVWKSDRPDVDIEYLVGQMMVGADWIDYSSNCGNITSAVGPYAIAQKLVEVTEPETVVRLLNCNSGKRINISLPCRNGEAIAEGDCQIPGVNGTSARLKVDFMEPGGTVTGRLFPTGKRQDCLKMNGRGKVTVTIIDVTGPIVLVPAEAFGATAIENPGEISSNQRLCRQMEEIRGQAEILLRMALDAETAATTAPSLPQIAMFGNPDSFKDDHGNTVSAESMDLAIRVMLGGKCHNACTVVCGCSMAAASEIEGTVITQHPKFSKKHPNQLRLGTPGGVMEVGAKVSNGMGAVAEIPTVLSASLDRTAKCLIAGTVFVKE